MIEGPTLVAEAIAAGIELDAVYVDEAVGSPDGCDPTWVTTGVLAKVLDTVSPRPVAAVAVIAPARTDDLIATATRTARPIIVLDQVNDPGNAGTILRAAEAAGAAGAVFTEGSVDPWSPKTVRSSAGSSFRLDVALAQLDELAPLELVGTAAQADQSHLDADLSGPIAIVMGNEARGLDPALGRHGAPIDRWVRIEMEGRTDSLNVAMAATVLLFEAMRQRRGPA